MARPTKQGIEYFPLDCQFDTKTEMYILEKESNGLSVLITLWQIIYSNEGYYIQYNDDLLLLIKKRININTEIINDCIMALIKREIFDNKLFAKYKILTSKAIQKRYFDAGKRKKEIIFFKEFRLIPVNAYKNLIIVSINDENAYNNTTKEKEKEKVNVNVNVNVNKKEKEVSVNPPRATFQKPKPEELKNYFAERGVNSDEYERFYDFYESKNWLVGKAKMKDWKAAVRNWIRGMSQFNNDIQEQEQRQDINKQKQLRLSYQALDYFKKELQGLETDEDYFNYILQEMHKSGSIANIHLCNLNTEHAIVVKRRINELQKHFKNEGIKTDENV